MRDSTMIFDEEHSVLAHAVADGEALRGELDQTRAQLAEALERAESAERDAHFLRLQNVVSESFIDDLQTDVARVQESRNSDARAHEDMLARRAVSAAQAVEIYVGKLNGLHERSTTLELMCHELIGAFDAEAKQSRAASERAAEFEHRVRAAEEVSAANLQAALLSRAEARADGERAAELERRIRAVEQASTQNLHAALLAGAERNALAARIDEMLARETAETERQIHETELMTHYVVSSKFWRLKLWLRRLAGRGPE